MKGKTHIFLGDAHNGCDVVITGEVLPGGYVDDLYAADTEGNELIVETVIADYAGEMRKTIEEVRMDLECEIMENANDRETARREDYWDSIRDMMRDEGCGL
jgi:hypothetical protein